MKKNSTKDKKQQYDKLSDAELNYVDDKLSALLLQTPKSSKYIIWITFLFVIIAIIWANWAVIDKVTVGVGKVIPASQVQVIQNLEGGVVKSILVKEGQFVSKDQQLLLIDDTLFRANYKEREQNIINLKASAIQLKSSIDSVKITDNFTHDNWQNNVHISYSNLNFPKAIHRLHPELVKRHKAEYEQDLNKLRNQLSVIDQQVEQKRQDLIEVKAQFNIAKQSYKYAQRELKLTQPLAKEGVVPEIELLKLQRRVNDAYSDLTAAKSKIPVLEANILEIMLSRIEAGQNFRSEQQEKLNRIEDDLSALNESAVGLQDKVARTVITSPVNGTVKSIHTNTIGGVIQPGMPILEVVPTEDTLVVEAQILPKDIAFLRPDLPAIVKLTAYEFSTYGGLEAKLEYISADTSQNDDGDSFYTVRVRTNKAGFGEKEALKIIPGMTASVDIITGKRTLLEYLINPIIEAKNKALKE